MDQERKMTSTSSEVSMGELLQANNVFAIPYFQRPYKWKKPKIDQFHQDLLKAVDESGVHFFGAVITHGHRKKASTDPGVYDVIDGQQRLITTILYLCGIIRVLCDDEEYTDAARIFKTTLVVDADADLESNMKLHPSKEDRAQINYVYQTLLGEPKLVDAMGAFQLKPLPSTGQETGRLRSNYHAVLRLLREQLKVGGVDRIRALREATLGSLSVVEIDIRDPSNGPKVFDGLNSKQEPMSIGDLVRNEVFAGSMNRDVEKLEELDEKHWQPFYKKFTSIRTDAFDKYFFPYGLIRNSNLQKGEVYVWLRDSWRKRKMKPETVIKHLGEFQDAFLDVLTGSNSQGLGKKAAAAFRRLHDLNAPGSVYPFLMQVSNSMRKGELTARVGQGVLAEIEGFLVRRAVCGHEPTGLHAVFKRLWKDCGHSPTAASVRKKIGQHTTVAWPGNDEFGVAIEERELYGAGITSYLLLEYDRSLKGDEPDNVPWIEHILPQNPAKAWFDIFDKKEHRLRVNRLANLIPLTAEMNRKLSNSTYIKKRPSYQKDSVFKSAREVADCYATWTPGDMRNRGAVLREWAIRRWPKQ